MTKCPKEFDLFCCAERDTEGNMSIYVPKWVLRAMRKKNLFGFYRVHFSQRGGLYNGYTSIQKERIETKIKKYMRSNACHRLCKKIRKEEKVKQCLNGLEHILNKKCPKQEQTRRKRY